jgi:hypothetical protein
MIGLLKVVPFLEKKFLFSQKKAEGRGQKAKIRNKKKEKGQKLLLPYFRKGMVQNAPG